MEEITNAIAKYQLIINAAIKDFCQQSLVEAKSDYGENFTQIFETYLSVLQRGGKRFRGALAMHSYELFGGEDPEVSRQIGLVMEMLQAYLLIIDDFVDQSDFRRGELAAHKMIENLHATSKLSGDMTHFGISQTIFAGIIGQNIAYDIIAKLPIEDSIRLAGLTFVNDIMIKTNGGQIMDVNNAAWLVDDEAQILQTLRQKTAYYSLFLPIKIGTILAGGDAEFIEPFAMNVGLAYQLHNDIQGTFGDESKTGKPAKDDIVEGKRTILLAYALTNTAPTDREFLERAVGNTNLTNDDFERVLKIMRDSGALEYTLKLATHYTDLAARILDSAPKELADKLDLFRIITKQSA